MLPEKYPYQWLSEITANYDRINDFFLELVQKYSDKRSFAIKIFVFAVLIFIFYVSRVVIGGFIRMMLK